jgi:2-polyprenyl-6-methoxyphenol hydroxylase-like FAD-dependent oxidoreductase
MNTSKKLAIVGGGIGGLALQRGGYAVTLYKQSDDLKQIISSSSRYCR